MIRRRLTAALLLGVAPTLAVTPVASQDASGELGFVDAGGLHITYGDIFADAQRREGRSAKSRRQAYERCRNPSDGTVERLLGIGIGSVAGRRFDPRTLLGPRRQPAPRTDCGEAPAAAASVASALIVDTNAGNGERYAVLARAVFHSPGDNLVPDSRALGGRCVALMDTSGQLIPVRSRADPDPFGFANAFAANPVTVLETRVTQLRARISGLSHEAETARVTLANLASFDKRGGACVTPPREAIPPRPASMSDAEIEDQAAGSCMDIMTRRQDPAKVYASVRSIRSDWMIAAMRRYQAHPASCAGVMPNQGDDFVLRMTCTMSDIACYGHMQTIIQQCMALVRASCGSPLQAWRQRVDSINAAPANARAQCEATRRTAETASREIVEARVGLAAAEADLARALAMPAPRAIPLSQARCGG